MNEKAQRNILLLLIAAVIMYLAWRAIFQLMSLSIRHIAPFPYNPNSRSPKSDYYNWAEPLAKKIGRDYGLPWQAILVHTALETGFGKSTLLRTHNNFAGIKDTDGYNATKPLTTIEYFGGVRTEIKDGFEVYPTPYLGMVGYARFLRLNPRYTAALQFRNDPYRFVEEIKKAGWATDPNYVAKLHGMLKTDLKVSRS